MDEGSTNSKQPSGITQQQPSSHTVPFPLLTSFRLLLPYIPLDSTSPTVWNCFEVEAIFPIIDNKHWLKSTPTFSHFLELDKASFWDVTLVYKQKVGYARKSARRWLFTSCFDRQQDNKLQVVCTYKIVLPSGSEAGK